jgi:DNA-binding MarR family transcriptional regulator
MSNDLGPGPAEYPVSDAEIIEVGSLMPAFLRAGARETLAVPPAMRDRALARRHLNVIITLSVGGPMNVTELSTRLGVTHSTASLLVGQLSRAGLVERTEDDHDRRRTIVSLAKTPRREITEYLDRRVAIAREALSKLTPSGRAAFIKGMQAMIEAWDAANGG